MLYTPNNQPGSGGRSEAESGTSTGFRTSTGFYIRQGVRRVKGHAGYTEMEQSKIGQKMSFGFKSPATGSFKCNLKFSRLLLYNKITLAGRGECPLWIYCKNS